MTRSKCTLNVHVDDCGSDRAFCACLRFFPAIVTRKLKETMAVSQYVYLSVLVYSCTCEKSSLKDQVLFQFKVRKYAPHSRMCTCSAHFIEDASVVTCVDFRQLAIPESSAAQTKIAEEKVCRYATSLLLLRILALRSRISLLSLTASYSALKLK